MKLDERFIINLKGKEFVTYEGLLDVAHQMKLKSIETELIQIPIKENNNTCIMKATATTEDGKTFDGYGDANNSNVNRMVAIHLIRMAETRAKARALRDLTNIGMTAIEEIVEEYEPKATKQKPRKSKQQPNKPSKYITDKQRKRMFAIAKGDAELVKEAIEEFGFKGTDEITKAKYNDICKYIEEMKDLPDVFK